MVDTVTANIPAAQPRERETSQRSWLAGQALRLKLRYALFALGAVVLIGGERVVLALRRALRRDRRCLCRRATCWTSPPTSPVSSIRSWCMRASTWRRARSCSASTRRGSSSRSTRRGPIWRRPRSQLKSLRGRLCERTPRQVAVRQADRRRRPGDVRALCRSGHAQRGDPPAIRRCEVQAGGGPGRAGCQPGQGDRSAGAARRQRGSCRSSRCRPTSSPPRSSARPSATSATAWCARPIAGVVTQVSKLQPGQFLAAGTAAFGLVDTEHMWIAAEPKETALTYARPGDPATVTVDAYPGHVWHGVLQSVAPATDQQFSVLPARELLGQLGEGGAACAAARGDPCGARTTRRCPPA